MRKIAIYGKGGIGKSTTTSNIAAALSVLGYKVMQIGCDPKADSVKNLMGGTKIPTVLDQMRSNEEVKLEDIVFKGFGDVHCVEAGGPTPGIGCAGRGIITAFEKLEELSAYEIYEPESNLDFKNQLIILDTIKKLSRDRNISAIVNTHYPAHVLSLSDKALMLNRDGTSFYGDASQVINEENMKTVFGVNVHVDEYQESNVIYKSVIPLSLAV